MTIASALAAVATACSPANLPTLPGASAPLETGAVPLQPYVESTLMAPGVPTEVYSLVARGALGCWFGANGPLRASHIFNADAAPPSQGGAAEIVIQERDVTLRDQRGVRAFRISFADAAGGARVGIAASKMPAPLAALMIRDVEVWAKGGTGCQARALAPSQTVAQPEPAQPAKRKPTSAKR